jgi:hypothetical protein
MGYVMFEVEDFGVVGTVAYKDCGVSAQALQGAVVIMVQVQILYLGPVD